MNKIVLVVCVLFFVACVQSGPITKEEIKVKRDLFMTQSGTLVRPVVIGGMRPLVLGGVRPVVLGGVRPVVLGGVRPVVVQQPVVHFG